MTATEATAFWAMVVDADPATGVWIGSGRALSFLFNCTLSEKCARRALEGLEKNPEGPYIKRFTTPGKHGNYPILINRFEVTAGARMGLRLNADATVNWREPVYYDPQAMGEEMGEEMGEDVGKHEGQYVGEQRGKDVSPNIESRIEKLEIKNPAFAGMTAGAGMVSRPKARKPPSEALPILDPAKQYAYRRWQEKFGSKPSWGPKDYAGLARLLRRQRELTLAEFRARWDRYLEDRDPFPAKMGHSLTYFCSRFDTYIDRSGLDVPLATPYEG
jgi:hypothetical protein